MPRIIYALCARYPTEKAYGVTTMRTAQSFRSLGSEVTIVAPGASITDPSGNAVLGLNSSAINFISNGLHSRVLPIRIASFQLRSLLVAIAVRRMFTTNNPETILITREPIVALLVSKRVDKILEIHHYPKGLNFLYCRLLNFKSRLFIATLTETHKELLMSLFKNKIIGIAPMGVPDEFFIDSHQNNSEICIGYIGKGWSSGEDNHLEDLIFCQDYLQKKFNLRTTLLFIGLELDYKSRLIDVYDLIDNPNKKAKFIDHVPHEALSDYLGLIDFGVLPYRESTYNAQRFPLKSLEYAASGISIVASNTKSHLNLLNKENSTFYESGNYVDLACKIFELNLNPEIAEDKRTIARFWAKNFSYKARAEAFLSLVMQ